MRLFDGFLTSVGTILGTSENACDGRLESEVVAFSVKEQRLLLL
jgi:hypothetical protein